MRTSKKIVSLVLAVMMVASMMVVGVVSASAADGTIASLSDLYYALQSSGTYTLTADIDVQQYCFATAENVDVTLDLDGYTITGSSYVLWAKAGSTLTLKNGTVETTSTSNSACAIYNQGTVNVEAGATILGNGAQGVTCNAGSELNVNGGTIKSEVWAVTVWGACTVNVNSGLVECTGEEMGISTNGNSGNGGYTININGGTVKGHSGIYHNNLGTLNITGGTIEGETAVYVKAGQTNISGGTLIATGSGTNYTFNGNGLNSTGNALAVDSCHYPAGTPSVNITGGTFVAANAAAVGSYTKSEDPNYTGDDSPKVDKFISGGEFTGADDMSDAIIADGVTKVQLDTDTEIIAKGTINNETDLATAIAAGGYWVVGDNFTITNNTDVPADTDFTLNLGGKTVTVTPWTFKNHGNLTVTGEGNMNADKGIIDNYGNLVLSGGTYATTLGNPAFWNNTSDSSIVVDGATINAKGFAFRNEKGTITINSGSVNSEDSAIMNDAGADVVVNGGTINAAQYGVYNEGTTTVNGGTIEGETGIGSKGTVTVDGGTIAGDPDGWGIVTWAGSTTNVNDGTITGGYGISGNGNETGYTINVTGGTITGDDLGIYNPGYGYVNISGGTIEGATAVYSKSGETNISGGTLRAVLRPGKSYDYYGNGGKPTGDAVVIDNCNYPGGTPSVSITGGNFETTDDSKDAVHSYVQSDDEDLPATVTNPTTDNARITGFISGGTFSSDVTELCADGLVAEGSGSTFSIVPFTTDGKADIDGYQRKVQNGSPESTELTGNDITTQGVRIITNVDRDWLDANADDYGYIVGKVTDGQKTFEQSNTNFTSFTAANGAKKISCKTSTNEGLGLNEDSITLAINGMDSGDKAVARFYVELNGVTYYANYGTYTGILAAY